MDSSAGDDKLARGLQRAPVPVPREHVVLVDHSGLSLYVNNPTNGQQFLTREGSNVFKEHLAAITNAIAMDTKFVHQAPTASKGS